MRRYKRNVKFLIIIVTLNHWDDVRGNTVKNYKSEDDNFKEKAINTEEDETEEGNEPPFQSKFEAFKKLLQENGEKIKNTENTETNFYTSDLGTLDSDSDTPNTIHTRIQEMPLKIGLQFLTAKHGLSENLGKVKQAGHYIYKGTKGAVKTMTNFVGEGIGNTRYLLFGAK